MDEVGLDVATKAGGIVAEAFGARMAPNESIQRVIKAGRLGRKGKRGFYQYDDAGKKGGVDSSVYELLPTGQRRTTVPAARIVQRCVYAMLNEAVLCLEDGILRSCARRRHRRGFRNRLPAISRRAIPLHRSDRCRERRRDA